MIAASLSNDVVTMRGEGHLTSKAPSLRPGTEPLCLLRGLASATALIVRSRP